MDSKQCKYNAEDGTKCKGYAITDSQYCLSHDPDKQEERLARAQKGGMAQEYQSLDLQLPPLTVGSAGDIIKASIQLVNELRTGKVPPKIATTIGYLLGIALKAIEVSEVEQRIGTIERVIFERSTK